MELVGGLSKISEFSKEVHDKINEAIQKEPFIVRETVYFRCFRWSRKEFRAELEACNLGIKVVDSRTIKSWFSKLVVFDLVGDCKAIREFVGKTFPTTSS